MRQWLQTWFRKKKFKAPNNWDDAIFNMMHRIKYRRAPLCIRSKDSNITYASLILDIDPIRKIILLEEFFSKQGLHVFKPKQVIVVSTRYNDQHVNFECTIQKKMRHHGLQGLVVQWPDKIAYLH